MRTLLTRTPPANVHIPCLHAPPAHVHTPCSRAHPPHTSGGTTAICLLSAPAECARWVRQLSASAECVSWVRPLSAPAECVSWVRHLSAPAECATPAAYGPGWCIGRCMDQGLLQGSGRCKDRWLHGPRTLHGSDRFWLPVLSIQGGVAWPAVRWPGGEYWCTLNHSRTQISLNHSQFLITSIFNSIQSF